MTPYAADSHSHAWLPYLGAAVIAHGVLAFFLLLGQPLQYIAKDTPQLLTFRLVPPAEGESAIYMKSANSNMVPPAGRDGIADVGTDEGADVPSPLDDVAGDVPDAQLAEILATEREALRAELNQMTELADASPVSAKPVPLPPPEGGAGSSGPGPEGAVRELDLDGFPQPIVDDIMDRYKLKVVTQTITGGRRGQSFLSSASKGKTEQYFGGMEVPAGVYEVFQLSRESVALMSRLEEEALRKEGFEPLKARVIRIVFGIVKQNDGKYVLGVKSLEAEAVAR